MSLTRPRHSPQSVQPTVLDLSRADVPLILNRIQNGVPVVKVTSIHLPSLSDDDMAIFSQAIATSVSMGLMPDLRSVVLPDQEASKNALFEIQQLNSFLREARSYKRKIK